MNEIGNKASSLLVGERLCFFLYLSDAHEGIKGDLDDSRKIEDVLMNCLEGTDLRALPRPAARRMTFVNCG